jgi:hypothetical protein
MPADISFRLDLRAGSFAVPSQDPVLMSVFSIVVVIVLAVWCVESIAFLAGYKHSLSS